MAKPLFITKLKNKSEKYEKDFKKEVIESAERLANSALIELRDFLVSKDINFTKAASEGLFVKKMGIRSAAKQISIFIHSKATSEEGQRYFTKYLIQGQPRDEEDQSLDRMTKWVKKKYSFKKKNPASIAKKLIKRFEEEGSAGNSELEDKIKQLNEQFVDDMREELPLIRDRVWQRNFRKSRAKTPPAPF